MNSISANVYSEWYFFQSKQIYSEPLCGFLLILTQMSLTFMSMESKRMKSKTFCFSRERIDGVVDSHELQSDERVGGATFV